MRMDTEERPTGPSRDRAKDCFSRGKAADKRERGREESFFRGQEKAKENRDTRREHRRELKGEEACPLYISGRCTYTERNILGKILDENFNERKKDFHFFLQPKTLSPS